MVKMGYIVLVPLIACSLPACGTSPELGVHVTLATNGRPVLTNSGAKTIWYPAALMEVQIPMLVRVPKGRMGFQPDGTHISPIYEFKTFYRKKRIEAAFVHTLHWRTERAASEWPQLIPKSRILEVGWLPLKPGSRIEAVTPGLPSNTRLHPGLIVVPWNSLELAFVAVRIRSDAADPASERTVRSSPRQERVQGRKRP